MRVSEIVANRLRLMGTSQAQIAKEIGTNPTQMGVFLKGKGKLSDEILGKCLEVVGIDLSIYDARIIKATEVATLLLNKNITQLDQLKKEDFINLTGMKELMVLVDVDSIEAYNAILESKLVDPESTFPYFKSLVEYILNIQIQSEKREIYELYQSTKKKVETIIKDEDAIWDREYQIHRIHAELKKTLIKTKIESMMMKITSNLAKTSLESFVGNESSDNTPKRIQRGSILLFSKQAKQSLNEKAIEYTRDGKI